MLSACGSPCSTGHHFPSLREESGDTTLPSSGQWEACKAWGKSSQKRGMLAILLQFCQLTSRLRFCQHWSDWISRPRLPKVDLWLSKCNGLWENREMTSRSGKSLGLESALCGTEESCDFWIAQLPAVSSVKLDNNTYIMRMKDILEHIVCAKIALHGLTPWYSVSALRFSSGTAWVETQLRGLLNKWPGHVFGLAVLQFLLLPRVTYFAHRVILSNKWIDVCKGVTTVSNTIFANTCLKFTIFHSRTTKGMLITDECMAQS